VEGAAAYIGLTSSLSGNGNIGAPFVDSHATMSQRLPPLNALRLFEAAARHRSFKLAAAELNVTPGAVSHGIGALEAMLGVELFVREPRGLSLSAAGEHYLPYIAEAFSLIVVGTQSLPDRRKRRAISVTCAPTLAARWLVPRLADFRARWPNIDVTVDTSRRQAGFPVDGFDFGLRLSRGPVDGASSWQRLFGERLVPVCSPAFRISPAPHSFTSIRPVRTGKRGWTARASTVSICTAAFASIPFSSASMPPRPGLASSSAGVRSSIASWRRARWSKRPRRASRRKPPTGSARRRKRARARISSRFATG